MMDTTEPDENQNVGDAADVVRVQLLTEDNLSSKYGVIKDKSDWKVKGNKMLKRNCTCSSQELKKFFLTIIPILHWLPKYKIKESLIGDLAAGLIVGIVHIPQGMAYALLASLPPVTGLYTSFLPVLVYVFFGTSKHVSIGTFAVISLMVGQAIDNHIDQCPDAEEGSSMAISDMTTLSSTTSSINVTSALSTSGGYDSCDALREQRKIEVAIALALACGVIQIIMFIFRLGVVTIYMSDHLVSAFTCGVAFYVLTSQIPKLLGLKIKRYSGPLSLIYTYIDIFKTITHTNWPTVVVSLCCIIFLVTGKEISARFQDKLPIPFPWELIVVIFSTIASYFGHIGPKYHVSTVGNIPTGIPTSIPTTSDIEMVLVDAITIAIVTYAIEISLCQMFAVKYSYEVDSNQELLALGIGNVVGAFFTCFPTSGCLSRSIIWEEAGAKTQLTGIFSSAVILLVLLWIAPLFQSLPQAALAAMIVVSLKSLLMQFEKVKPLWQVSAFDAFSWVVTWIVVILLGVELGLLVAVCIAIVTIIFRTQVEQGVVLGEVGGTGIYRNRKDYLVEKEDNIIIFQFPGPIYYANRNRFKSEVTKVLGFDPIMQSAKKKNKRNKGEKTSLKTKLQRICFTSENVPAESIRKTKNAELSSRTTYHESFHNGKEDESKMNGNVTDVFYGNQALDEIDVKGRCFIMDMSATTFLDNDGAQTIHALKSALQNLSIDLLFVACNNTVRHVLTVVEHKPPFFLTIEKAKEFARGDFDLQEIGNGCHQEPLDTRL